MKRLLIAPVLALALTGCGVAPEELEARTDDAKELTIAGCETLDDALVAVTVDVIAELTGTAKGVEAIRERRRRLCEAAAAPVDPDGEVEKPAG
mgnify:CR=1 FL=1